MDFDFDWNLHDARFVAGELYNAYADNPSDKKAERKLTKRGQMYTTSIMVLNGACKEEMAKYRKAVVARAPKEEQEKILAELYAKYSDGMSRVPFQRFFAKFGIS
jgi:hypothetical protein